MSYKEDVVSQGLHAYRFWGANTTFANGSVVKGNDCYCVDGTCAPTGGSGQKGKRRRSSSALY